MAAPNGFAPNQTIPQHTRQQFQDAFAAAVQQMDSKFAQYTNVDAAWTADIYTKRQRTKVEWLVNNARFGGNTAGEFVAGFRTGIVDRMDMKPIKFDRADKGRLDTLALPTGHVIEDAKHGLARLRDQLAIKAALADARGGPHPHMDVISFPSDQVVPINYVKPGAALGSNSGLHLWKVLRAKRIFEGLNVDLDREELVLAIHPDDKDSLLLSAELAPNESWAKMTLDWYAKYESGQRDAKLMGFNVLQTTNLTTVGSVRHAVAFCKRAFCWKPLAAPEMKIDEGDAENRHAITISGYAEFGCFRELDELVLDLPLAI